MTSTPPQANGHQTDAPRDPADEAQQLAQWLASQEWQWRDVTFPSGHVVRACPLPLRAANADWRQYGLYAEARWAPDWPATVIDWPDFGLPRDAEAAAQVIVATWRQVCAGTRVEVGCLGAQGRTGVLLACMALLDGVGADEAVAWVRSTYRSGAVETPEQEAWVRWFGAWLAGTQANDHAERIPPAPEGTDR